MIHVRQPLASARPELPEIPVRVDRHTLAKRIWRAAADDGLEFGVEAEAALPTGSVLHQSDTARYVVRQEEEALIEIPLELPASAAAGIGWSIGNLHLDLSGEPHRLLTPDEPVVRQLLTKLNIPHRCTTGVFRPGRFARGTTPAHELGPSLKH